MWQIRLVQKRDIANTGKRPKIALENTRFFGVYLTPLPNRSAAVTGSGLRSRLRIPLYPKQGPRLRCGQHEKKMWGAYRPPPWLCPFPEPSVFATPIFGTFYDLETFSLFSQVPSQNQLASSLSRYLTNSQPRPPMIIDYY